MESLRNRGLEDLASLAVDEAEPERGGALAEATQDTRALLNVVGIGAGIAIHQLSFEGAIDEGRELAGGRGDGLRFANPGGQPPIEGPESGLCAPEGHGAHPEDGG